LRKAIEASSGKWIVFLDADDELFSFSLDLMDQAIKKNKGYRLFNFESYHVSPNFKGRVRGSFKPPLEGDGHEVFGGGNIVNGTYIFHQELVKKYGSYPQDVEKVDTTELNYGGVRSLRMTSPYDFSVAAQLEFPEIRPFFSVTNDDIPGKVIKELGNPWGQDYYLFYKYTRNHVSKSLDVPVYIVHEEGKNEDGKHKIG
jgi:glycosyltransferase involved in cell wall biosynthesis